MYNCWILCFFSNIALRESIKSSDFEAFLLALAIWYWARVNFLDVTCWPVFRFNDFLCLFFSSLQQPSPVGCSSCNSKGHVECKWCAGTGFFILGDNMLCQVPSRNTSCVICSGQVCYLIKTKVQTHYCVFLFIYLPKYEQIRFFQWF